MLRSMYSGISGMKVNQTKLDVIGNNIANVNTTSFKSSRANFSDLLSQNTSSAQGASTTKGGTNAKQVGLGVQLASIDKIMTQGSMQTTNRALDVAIDGVGYLMVSTGPAIAGDGTLQVNHKSGTHAIDAQSSQTSGAQVSYTRDGSFIRDNEGNLLTSSGYRVLGYSLTNDNNNIGATSVKPDAVHLNESLKFTFGPGSQLNEYTIQLGAVGSGTATDAVIDTGKQTITISGDFTKGTQLTADAIATALKGELTKKGISQTISVSGSVTEIPEVNSSAEISGGKDATAPGSVNCGGFTFKFSPGEELEGYSIELGDVSADHTSVDIEGTVIKISGDFAHSTIEASDIEKQINDKLKNDPKLAAASIEVTGNPKSLTKLSATTGTATAEKAPGLSSTEPKSDGTNFTPITPATLAGFTIDSSILKGNDLNRYKIEFSSTTGKPDVKVDTTKNTITITGDLSKIVESGVVNTDAGEVSIANFNNQISTRLSEAGIKDASFTISGKFKDDVTTKSAYFGGGVDDASAGNVEVGGFTIEMPKPSELEALGIPKTMFDNIQVCIGSIKATDTAATFKDGKLTINGDFTGYDTTKEKVQGAIDAAIKKALDDAHIIPTGDIANLVSVNNSGSNTVYSSIKSQTITGGANITKANPINALGIEFKQANGGAALNGYKIQIGTITKGTDLGAVVDTSKKTITISGDFTKQHNAGQICEKINDAISNSALGNGIGFVVDNKEQKTNTIGSTESDKILGGTSVQSIAADGSINFVNASSVVKSYDGSLKTLKIPEKVKIAGSDTELAVEEYSIDANGMIIGILENGSRAALGQIAMASFSNPEGLTSIGNNLFSESSNSGTAFVKSGIKTTGESNEDGFGTVRQGYLEMSNVDLAEQFTDMIVTTKAFQGASKMITTGDEILSEIINLKR